MLFSYFEFIGCFFFSFVGITVARWEDQEFDSKGKQFLDTQKMECFCGAIRSKYTCSRVSSELYIGKLKIVFSSIRVLEILDV